MAYSSEIPDEKDFVDVWLWFFHRQIVRMAYKEKLNIFLKDRSWDRYVTCVLAPTLDEKFYGITKYFPKIKKGSVEVGMKFIAASTKVGLDFEFQDSGKTKAKFNYIVKKANELFNELLPGTETLYIMLDELELSLANTQLYERDSEIIRDLIVSIEKMNTISKKKRFNLKIIGAIRSEVLTVVASLGKEINKTIADFGIPINWSQSGGNVNTHPLLQIILKRIVSSEKYYNLRNITDDQSIDFEQIWETYFDKKIQDMPSANDILNLTWNRPRDIIRLLTLAQVNYPNFNKFNQEVFDGIKKEYSKASWIELSEELRTTFNSDEVGAIKRLFYGYKPNFSLEELRSHVDSACCEYNNVRDLLNKHELGTLLSTLYRVGYIGNVIKVGYKSRYSFCYRGDDDIMLENFITIHRGLRPYLSML